MEARATRWRLALLGLCALALLLCAFDIFSENVWPLQGQVGWTTASDAAVPFVVDILWVAPGLPDDRAGVRAGDKFGLRDLTFRERLQYQAISAAGSVFHFKLHRNGKIIPVTVKSIPYPEFTWDVWLGVIASLWMLLLAAVIAWRSPQDPRARILCIALLFGIANSLSQPIFVTSSPLMNVLGEAVLGFAASYAVFGAFAALSATFERSASPFRRAVLWLTYLCVSIGVLLGAIWMVADLTLWFDTTRGLFLTGGIYFYVGVSLLAVLCSVLAVRESRGAERQRALWALTFVNLWLLAGVILFFIGNVLPQIQNHAPWAVTIAQNLVNFVAPAGLTYAILKRHLLDTGFAINRAAVFTVLSLIIVAVFVLLEWLVGLTFASVNKTASMAISLAIALVLGMSMRLIHRRVDSTVDRLFFRKRHDDERALRRFAHEACFITDIQTLLRKTAETVRMHAGTQDVQVLALGINDDCVDPDDDALVSMRAWQKTIDLRKCTTTLPGQIAFPMIARGRLLGALLCGEKPSGEEYAPDERDAILAAAEGVANALDLLILSASENDVKSELREIRALLERREAGPMLKQV